MSSEQFPQNRIDAAAESLSSTRECVVAEAARIQLCDWGIDDAHIQQLAEIAALYNYADCEGVLRRILQRPATVTYMTDSETKQDKEAIILDPAYDFDDAKSGQCSEIAFKVGRELYVQGWLAAVNEQNDALGLPVLALYHSEGRTKDFFCKEGARHVWLTLTPDGAEGEVVIDGSFLQIVSRSKDDYIASAHSPLQHPYKLRVDSAVLLGDYYMAKSEHRLNPSNALVLGLCADRQMCVNLAFIADQVQEGGVLPVIHLLDKDGAFVATAFQTNDGVLWDAEAAVEEKYGDEVVRLLTIAESFHYEEGGAVGMMYEPKRQQVHASLGQLSVARKS